MKKIYKQLIILTACIAVLFLSVYTFNFGKFLYDSYPRYEIVERIIEEDCYLSRCSNLPEEVSADNVVEYYCEDFDYIFEEIVPMNEFYDSNVDDDIYNTIISANIEYLEENNPDTKINTTREYLNIYMIKKVSYDTKTKRCYIKEKIRIN